MTHSRAPELAVHASRGTAFYAEDRCALNWRFLTAGVYGPAAGFALVVAALTSGRQFFFLMALVFFMITLAAWVVCSGDWVRYAWPAGIRLDGTGVRIGGVRWTEAHPGRARARLATVPRQYSQVFSCPWSGVLSIGITTDRELLKLMNRRAYRGRKLTALGNLAVPFMRAALVVWVDEAQARVPDIRPARGPMWINYPEAGYHQPVWVVPTRRSADLEGALALLPLPAGTVRDPSEIFAPDSRIADWTAAKIKREEAEPAAE
ncbi:MAG TPA: hypothetical protein VN767_06740 [Streptosporangiaceae bacterium]|nr:hypothetical protein [Streptosporangiaceae bacterium]